MALAASAANAGRFYDVYCTTNCYKQTASVQTRTVAWAQIQSGPSRSVTIWGSRLGGTSFFRSATNYALWTGSQSATRVICYNGNTGPLVHFVCYTDGSN